MNQDLLRVHSRTLWMGI